VPVRNDWPAIVWWAGVARGSVLWLRYRDCVMPGFDGGASASRMMSDKSTLVGIVSRAWIAWWGFGCAAVVFGLGCCSVKDGRCLGAYRWGRLASLLAIVFRLFSVEETSVGEDSESWVGRDAVLENLPFLPAVMSGACGGPFGGIGMDRWEPNSAGVGGLRVLVACVGSTVWVWMDPVRVHAWACGVQAVVVVRLAIMNRWGFV